MSQELYKSHSKHLPEFRSLLVRGHMNNKIIKIVDTDDPSGMTYNVYEDLDIENPGDDRRVLVCVFPLYAKLHANAMDLSQAMIEISHSQAVVDINKMIDQGYLIESIKRDNYL